MEVERRKWEAGQEEKRRVRGTRGVSSLGMDVEEMVEAERVRVAKVEENGKVPEKEL